MDLTTYRFRSVWHVPAERDVLFDVLSDIGSYPRWWPQVRTVERIDDDTASLSCRSVLPYDLNLRASRQREDRDAGTLQVRLTGDLDGWSRWTLPAHRASDGASDGDSTALLYEQEVVAHGRLLRWLGLVARPGLRLNHAWMMRSGREGLRRHLASFSG